MVCGIVITITGIMWISIAKGAGAVKIQGVAGADGQAEEMADTNKIYSVINALAVGCLNASQTVHGKFLMK